MSADVHCCVCQNTCGELPFRFSNIGRWWGKITRQIDGKKQTIAAEIDVLASDRTEENYILGECKFTTAAFDVGQLQAMKEKVTIQGNVYFYRYALSGFTDGVREIALDDPSLGLVTAADIWAV